MTDGADPAESELPEETDIRPLDETTVAKIAAGEVVERPASVVKELVENALDADASRVDVAVENGGIDGVEVTDDGVGMTEADLRASVREHTTSKLDDAAELERVETLGFRGEALHTIGAVSRMTITSRPRADRDDVGGDAAGAGTGTKVRYEGGELEAVEPAAHPEGTTVAVEDLFYNTPARRKYLAEPATEFGHVSTVVGRYALANPDVAVSLEHDGRSVFATTGDGDRQSAVLAVFGRDVAESMVAVDAEPETDAVERVEGLVSHPETTRASRDYLATYVNDRAVEADVLRSAIVEAYGGQLAAERYPFAVLFVTVPPERVDVNVHPRKLAVRFDDEAAVGDAVVDAVRDALLEEGIVRSSAPRGVSAPDEVSVEPQTLDAAGGSGGDAADGDDDGGDGGDEPREPAADAADASNVPATSDAGDASDGTGAAASATEPTASPTTDAGADDADATAVESSEPAATGSRDAAPDRATSSDRSTAAAETGNRSPAASDAASTGETASAEDDRQPSPSTDDRRFDASEQRTLGGDAASPDVAFDRLPSLRVLGQLRDTYVVAESEDGLVLVDQHAADERVHYERLRDAVDDGAAQALADPVELSLTPTEAATYDDYAPAIERLGFHADRDGQTLSVRSVPTVLGETLEPDVLRDVFAALLDGGDASGTVEHLADELLADLACAPAVTGNTSLTEGSVADLLAALDDCENPYECPHGRPTVVRIDADELDERFERDYPGHGVRED